MGKEVGRWRSVPPAADHSWISDKHELLWRLDRKHFQQESVYNGKNRCVRPDSEGEREYGDSSEGRVLDQHSQCIADVLKESIHTSVPHKAMPLFVSQCNYGIYLRRSLCRDEACEKRDSSE